MALDLGDLIARVRVDTRTADSELSGFDKRAQQATGKAGQSAGSKFGRELGSSVESGSRSAGEKAAENLSNPISSAAKKVGAIVAGGFALDKLKSVATFGLQVASQNEQAKISFGTMLGSAQKAGAFIKDLQQFAAKTPFDFPGLQQSASSLISVGINAKDVIPIMTTLGNVTSGMGTGAEGIQRATVALQQMTAAQKISAEDLNQLRDAGIPVYDLLSKAMGKSKQQVVKLAQSGGLGKKALDQMMAALKSGKGLERFQGLMDKQSRSLQGLWSTVQDTFGQGLAKAIAPSLPIIKKGLVAVTNMIGPAMTGLGHAISKGLDFGKRVHTALQPAITAVEGFYDTLSGKSGHKVLVGGTGLNLAVKLGKEAKSVFGTAKDTVHDFLSSMSDTAGGVDWKSILGAFTPLGSVLRGLAPVLGKVADAWVSIGAALGGALLKVLPVIVPAIANLAGAFGKTLAKVLPVVAGLIGNLARTIFPLVAKVIDQLVPPLAHLAVVLFPALAKIIMALLPIVGPVVGLLAKLAIAVLPIVVAVIKILVPVINVLAKILTGVATVLSDVIVWFVKFAESPKQARAALGKLGGWIKDVFVTFFTKDIPAGFHAAINAGKKVWGDITGVITKPFKAAGKGVSDGWDAITGSFTTSKNWVAGTWRKGWNGVSGWISGAVKAGGNAAGSAWSATRGAFSAAKSWVGGAWRREWAGVQAWIHDPVQAAKTSVSNILGSRGVQAVFSTLDSWGRTIFGRRWAGMKDKLTQPIQEAKAYLSKVFGPGGGGVRQIFSDFITGVGRIFARIRGAVTAPIKDLIGLINTGLIKGGINWLLNKLGVPRSKQIPWIPVPKGFAVGTENTGGRPGEPRGVVHGQEAVIPHLARERAERERPGGLGYLIKTGKWPVGPAAETRGANEQAPKGSGVPITGALPAALAAIARRGPKPGEPGGYGALASLGGGGAVNPIGFASREVGDYGWYNRCLAFVNAAWDYTVGRFRLATARQSAMAGPRTMGGTAPAGAAGYWDTGPAGHVALSNGDGRYFSNDVIRPGMISLVAKSMIDRWGPFMGWWSPTGAKGTAGGGVTGMITGALDFLKGLSPIKWLANKAAGLGKLGVGGMFGAALASSLPGYIVSRAGSYLGDKFGFLNGGIALRDQIAAFSEDGRPELVVGPQYRHVKAGTQTFNADQTAQIVSGSRQPNITILALDPIATGRELKKLGLTYERATGAVTMSRRTAGRS